MEANHNSQAIPEELYSYNTGKPFEKCSDCERELLQSGELYVIEKAIRQYEGYTAKDVIFECAICLHCAEKIRNELSAESLNNMMQYYQEIIVGDPQIPEGDTLAQCIVTGRKKEELGTYQVNALCQGNQLSPLQPPYLVSASVLDDMNELLSESTRDFLDDYQQKFIGPTPEWFVDSPSGGRLVLI